MKNTLIDSHCHLDRLDLTAYEGKLQGALEHARQLHVNKMLCVSIDLEAYPSMRDLVRDYDEVSISVGVHPNETEGHEPTVEELVELARDDKVVAIGETGLDYFRSEGNLEWQRDRFRTHIRAAKIAKKPLIIHSREAREDTIRVLQEENAHEVGGVMHCFAEDWDMAERALALNFYISFSGIVTFKTAETLRDVARRVPLDRILIETDSPYLAPVPFRGKTNEPAYVYYVAEKIAELRDLSLDEVASITSENYLRLFEPAAP